MMTDFSCNSEKAFFWPFPLQLKWHARSSVVVYRSTLLVASSTLLPPTAHDCSKNNTRQHKPRLEKPCFRRNILLYTSKTVERTWTGPTPINRPWSITKKYQPYHVLRFVAALVVNVKCCFLEVLPRIYKTRTFELRIMEELPIDSSWKNKTQCVNRDKATATFEKKRYPH